MIFEILLCFSVWLSQIFIGSLLILSFEKVAPSKWMLSVRAYLQQYFIAGFFAFLGLIICFLFKNVFFHWDHLLDSYYSDRSFLIRSVVDFSLWGFLFYLLTNKKLNFVGALALVILLFSVTQFSNDWVMSLDNHWKSTAFGLIFLLSSIISAFSLSLISLKKKEEDQVMSDFGSVHFTLIGSWTYLNFMQLLVVWSGNLPGESAWYVARLNTSWKFFYLYLAIVQVALPFFVLLMKRLKASLKWQQSIAMISFMSQALFTFLLIMPSLHPAGFAQEMSLVAFLICVFLVYFFFKKRFVT